MSADLSLEIIDPLDLDTTHGDDDIADLDLSLLSGRARYHLGDQGSRLTL